MGLQEKEEGKEKIKTLWDWLDLLIIPASIGLIGWLYKDYEKSKDEKKEQENKYSEILESYFKAISDLITKENLLDINNNNTSKKIARSRTILAIENLDGERKGQVLQFLFELDLIDTNKIDLLGANLANIQCDGIVLKNLTINGVHFGNSSFENSFLENCKFIACDFSNSTFLGASFQNVDFSYSKLNNCNFQYIDLTTLNLEGVELHRANISNSKILQNQLDNIFKKDNIKNKNTEIL